MIWQFHPKFLIGYTRSFDTELKTVSKFLFLGFWQFHWYSS